MEPAKWDSRARVRDPRYAGLILMAVGLGAGFAVLDRSHRGLAVGAALTAVVGLAVIGSVALPPWRDEKHPPRTAGIALAVIGMVALLVALIVGFGFGFG